ncbi:MAG: four helix bundle protein [Gemmatimonadetes bacterium]|nr:four helix bundle protein [Gemmatimonadota bacterium]MBI3568958.1 four helix bundle protein [Gemmatimonadota bacterium]
MPILLDPRLPAFESTVPRGIRDDVIWKFHVYRIALFLSYLARDDVRRPRPNGRWQSIAEQLMAAVASIGANVSEGYGRSRPVDRARFYDMAVGSLREAITWYDATRAFLPGELVDERTEQLTELRRMLHGALRTLRALPPETRLFG